MRGLSAVAWKEWREARALSGRMEAALPRSLVGLALPLAAAWMLAPRFGVSWLTAFVPAFTAMLVVGPIVPDAFAGERERHTLETLLAAPLSRGDLVLGKLLVPVALGWSLSLVALVAGVLLQRVRGGPAPVAAILAAAALSGLVAGMLVGSAGTLVSVTATTVRDAQQRLSLALLALGLAPALLTKVLPLAWRRSLVLRAATWTPGGVATGTLAGAALLSMLLLALALRASRSGRLLAPARAAAEP